jgi:hypothetical protein
MTLANVRVWHIATFRCDAEVQTRSEQSGHSAGGASEPICRK